MPEVRVSAGLIHRRMEYRTVVPWKPSHIRMQDTTF